MWLQRPQQAVLPTAPRTAAAASAEADTRADAAATLVQRLADRLEHGSRRSVVALAAPGDRGAARELGQIYDNVRAARVRDLSMRYVDDSQASLPSDVAGRYHGRAWWAQVALTWRLEGFDRSDSAMNVPLVLAGSGGRVGFVTARAPHQGAVPLWLLERLAVERSRRALVMVADGDGVRRYARLADRAVVAVRRVLPAWRGKLTLEVPRTGEDVGRLLDADPGEYANIAAVTTTVDGSASASAPTHIFVNPSVFDGLGPEGAQIVISHEATHVATRAATSSMPMWLLEGFADYVALDHVDLPVSVTASQILRDVRRHGVPAHLPGPTEFDPENKALGASYEAAWLACRLLGQEYGERRLIAFYRAADRDSGTSRAFRQVLGTTEARFTDEWQDYLQRLAS